MEFSSQKKLNAHIFRLLKVNEIVIPIGRTNKGNLGIKFSQNSEDYEIMLDSIPLSVKDFLADDNNIELKKMLDKYLFSSFEPWKEKALTSKTVEVTNTLEPVFKSILEADEPVMTVGPKEVPLTPPGHVLVEETPLQTPKRRGRPIGSKNKA